MFRSKFRNKKYWSLIKGHDTNILCKYWVITLNIPQQEIIKWKYSPSNKQMISRNHKNQAWLSYLIKKECSIKWTKSLCMTNNFATLQHTKRIMFNSNVAFFCGFLFVSFSQVVSTGTFSFFTKQVEPTNYFINCIHQAINEESYTRNLSNTSTT